MFTPTMFSHRRNMKGSASVYQAVAGVPSLNHRRAMVSQKAQPFQHFYKHYNMWTNKSPQAKHAETDPRHGTPTRAHFRPPECTLRDLDMATSL